MKKKKKLKYKENLFMKLNVKTKKVPYSLFSYFPSFCPSVLDTSAYLTFPLITICRTFVSLEASSQLSILGYPMATSLQEDYPHY